MRGTSGRTGVVLIAAGLLAAGCATTTMGEAEVVSPSGRLAGTMEVGVGSETTTLRLHVTNVSSAPVELEFTSGQRYDFAVTTEDGESLWTWSADKSFMQALGTETLQPGESLRYSETWPSSDRRGRFIGIGRITSTNEPVQQSVIFELTGSE